MGWEEGTSKHSSSQAHVGQWELPPKSWLEGTQRFRERKSSIQHIQICPRHRREGWARQKASCLAGRWRESSLSFQRCGSAGRQRSTDPQVVAQVSGQGGWSTGCSNSRREGKRTERTIAERRGRWQPSCFFQQWDIICIVLRCEG